MIPLIIPNFNQLFYLKNLVNWWRWMHPNKEEYPIIILDNCSTYQPLLEYYKTVEAEIINYPINDCATNLRSYLKGSDFEYYVISDPDILPHPATPHNYLETFKAGIDAGYHHAGFDLIIDDLPDWLHKKDWIISDEKLCLIQKVIFQGYEGYKAAIDTTFCLYKKSNGGWSAPMPGNQWGNGLRLFKAFHMKWYQDGNNLNPELVTYFETANYKDLTGISAGKNHFRPQQYEK